MKKRINEIDILKAIGIICMVVGHADTPAHDFIYLFHMAIFFMASGYVYKESNSDNLKNVWSHIKNKIKQVWLPFFFWNGVFQFMNNIFIDIGVYATGNYMTLKEMAWKTLIGAGFRSGTIMGGTFWFFQILSILSLMYVIADYLCKKIFKDKYLIWMFIGSIALLMFGYWCKLNGHGFKGLSKASSYFILYYLGFMLKKYKNLYIDKNYKFYVGALIISFVCLLVLNGYGTIELSANYYVNPMFLLACSISGWIFVYSVSFFINKTKLSNLMIWIGQRTLVIMIFNSFGVRVARIIYCILFGLPIVDMARVSVPHAWWIIDTICGIGVPLLISPLYEKVKRKLKLI